MAYERVKPVEKSRPKVVVQQPVIPKTIVTGEAGRTERCNDKELNVINVSQPPPQPLIPQNNLISSEISSEALPNVDPSINSLSAMLEPFTYETVEKPLISPSLMTFDTFEPNDQESIPLSPPVAHNPVIRIETVSRKDISNNGDRKTLTPKSTDGFKHLRGNTTWSPLTKRGRHGSQKNSHTSSSTNKKGEKRTHDGRKVAPSASMGRPPKIRTDMCVKM